MRFSYATRGGFQTRWTLEPLEARLVLSQVYDLAVVAMDFTEADGYTPSFAELVWGDDRSVTGNVYRPGATGPQGPTATTLAEMLDGPSGALRPSFTGDDLDHAIGSRVAPSATYPAGWIGGAMEDGSAANFSAMIERSPDVEASDLTGTWVYQAVRLVGDLVYTYHGGFTSFNATGGFIGLGIGGVDVQPDPTFAGEGFEFVGQPVKGRFDIAMQGGDTGVLYVSRDESVILFADLDERGDDLWMGVFMRHDGAATAQTLAGSYRGGVLAEGDFTAEYLDGPAGAWRLDLNANGTYQALDLAGSDAGSPGTPISQGTWAVTSGVAILTDTANGTEFSFKPSDNGSSLILMQIRVADENIFERPIGLFCRAAADPDADLDTTVVSGVFDGEGAPLVFDLRLEDDAWSVVDLDRYAVGDALGANAADVEAFQASDERVIAVITTDDGLFAAERGSDGFWRARNLTERIAGAENITSSITVFTDKTGKSYVAGLTEAGEVVQYIFDPAAAGGAGSWSHVNITDTQLTPKGQSTPQFTGPLISYVTDWNGLNMAGLDADGNIRAVWSNPGGTVWNAVNLTPIVNAPPMSSGLTAYLTEWGGINIVGLNDAGRVVAAWWVPGFGGNWQRADLTTASQGPTLTGESLTSFVAPWGALNVAGLDANGDMIAYWWVPANQQNGKGWEWVNLTGSIPDDEPRPTQQLQSQTNLSHGGELNILGTDETTGDLLRLFWRVGGAWQIENVSEEAAFS